MAFALLCRLHVQRVVEAIEIVEQPNRGQQLDDFAFVEMPAKLAPERVVHAIGIERGPFCQFKRSLLGVGEIGAVAEVRQVVDLLLAPAVPPCQGGVGGQSIFAAVELRGANNCQLLQLRGHRSRVHDRAEVRNHRPKDLRAMGYGAKHVGDVAALCEIGVVDFGSFRIDLVFFESRYTGHIRDCRPGAVHCQNLLGRQ